MTRAEICDKRKADNIHNRARKPSAARFSFLEARMATNTKCKGGKRKGGKGY